MRRQFLSPRLGQFAGNLPLPQEVGVALHDQLQDALTGDPGLRLAGQMGRRMFRAGSFQPQVFVRPPEAPNTKSQLEKAPVAINTRMSLNRFRGMPPQ